MTDMDFREILYGINFPIFGQNFVLTLIITGYFWQKIGLFCEMGWKEAFELNVEQNVFLDWIICIYNMI